MKTYRCNDCTAKFEEPNMVYGPHGQEYAHCPNCGRSDFEPMHLCPVSGEWILSKHDYHFSVYEAVEKMLKYMETELNTTEHHIEQIICNIKGW